MRGYSNDGWANLLSAVDYKNAEPDRELKRQQVMMQLQAMKDAKAKNDALSAFRSSLDNPVAPERTGQVLDESVADGLQGSSGNLAALQGTAYKDVKIPAQYLNDSQKLEKMEKYFAMQGDFDKAKAINEYRKQETQRMGFHQTFTQAFQMAGMDGAKTKELLIQHFGEGARAQLDNLEFTPSGVIQKKENLITPWETGKPQNLQKEATESAPSFNQGAMTDKGLSVGFHPKMNQWMVNINGVNEPYNEGKHGKIRQPREPHSAGMPEATQQEFLSDKRAILSGQMMIEDVLKGAGRGGQGQAYARKLRTEILKENPAFNFNLQKMMVRGDSTEISQAQGMRGKILSFEQAAIQNAKQLYQLSSKIDPAKIPELNRAILAGKTRIAGDEVASAYLLAWRTFVNEYARVSTTASGGGITTDTARREMEEAIRSAATAPQMQAMLRQAVMEMRHREYGYDVQLKQVYDKWGGRSNFEPHLPTEEDVYKIFASETPYVVPKEQSKARSNAPDAKQKTVVERRKTKDGRILTKYSDGSIE